MSKQKILRVAIGVPSNDMIHADFAMCLTNLVTASILKGIHVAVINQKSSIIEVGRCAIVEKAKQFGANYLLFLDSDMTFPRDMLTELLKHQKDIICCDAMTRREPFTSVVKTIKNERIDHTKCNELVEINGVSTACMLVNMDVFEKVGEPPFKVEYQGKGKFLGEDYYFSGKAIEKGYKVWCDAKLSKHIGHLGLTAYHLPRLEEKGNESNNVVNIK